MSASGQEVHILPSFANVLPIDREASRLGRLSIDEWLSEKRLERVFPFKPFV